MLWFYYGTLICENTYRLAITCLFHADLITGSKVKLEMYAQTYVIQTYNADSSTLFERSLQDTRGSLSFYESIRHKNLIQRALQISKSFFFRVSLLVGNCQTKLQAKLIKIIFTTKYVANSFRSSIFIFIKLISTWTRMSYQDDLLRKLHWWHNLRVRSGSSGVFDNRSWFKLIISLA